MGDDGLRHLHVEVGEHVGNHATHFFRNLLRAATRNCVTSSRVELRAPQQAGVECLSQTLSYKLGPGRPHGYGII